MQVIKLGHQHVLSISIQNAHSASGLEAAGKEVILLKEERINKYIQGVFILPLSTARLLNRKPSSAGTYSDSCRAKENHKSDTQYSRKKQTALIFLLLLCVNGRMYTSIEATRFCG